MTACSLTVLVFNKRTKVKHKRKIHPGYPNLNVPSTVEIPFIFIKNAYLLSCTWKRHTNSVWTKPHERQHNKTFHSASRTLGFIWSIHGKEEVFNQNYSVNHITYLPPYVAMQEPVWNKGRLTHVCMPPLISNCTRFLSYWLLDYTYLQS